ncbi:SDR family oxidoreductase [Variovorax sp. J22R133]|uniref:SDR family NAD(P)-dependent oxidoreductase n=1 Tax=Variovorax brevis TaxID=3053503 RepID=UPI002575F16B|nr:SDR family oxidoreductase [Variovorax sp. J22R133]MDM0111018.1 SDR family oxidoreductase [Variovorax sp. J22R133]
MTRSHASSRIALITGANRGIGRATALQLARDGIDVILTYRTHREEADEVVREIRALGRIATALQLDAAQVATFDVFVAGVRAVLRDTWQRDSFDFLVNNGGVQVAEPLEKVSEEGFDRLVDVHFKGVFFLTQKLLPLIGNPGSIVNVSSGTARFYTPDRAIYSSVKGAVEVLSRYLAHELGPRGITVNVIAPGAVATDFSGGMLRSNEQVQKHIASLTPLGRFGVAEDVAGAIGALLGDGNRFVTGQRIEVSGGIHL